MGGPNLILLILFIRIYPNVSHFQVPRCSAFRLITSVLRKPEFILVCSDKGVNKYLVSNEMLEKVWIRRRDRLSSLDSSTLLLEVTSEYAAHFY
jgi:hypothetical protein